MFKIRSPQINDFEKLEAAFKNKLHVRVFHETPLQQISIIFQDLIPYNLRLLPTIHIAVDEKNILGYIVLSCASKPNNCWQINEVFVFDEMRNKGVGEELLRYVLSVYGSKGIEHFLTEVDPQNLPAVSLFQECGFRRYARVGFYEKEINVEALHATLLLDNDFILRAQIKSDLTELEKLDLSSIPPDLRPALGRSKEYFKEKKNTFVLIDKARNLIVGWSQVLVTSNDNYFVELLVSPGWTHLYEQFLNTLITDCIAVKSPKIKLTIKVIDYLTELTETLTKSGFLKTEIKELLVKTIWQKVKEKKLKAAKVGVPWAAPT